jgi:methylthioribose-1-phosphate isomerase
VTVQIIKPLIFENGTLKVLDQRALPSEEIYINCTNLEDCFDVIKSMAIRGAPCIGFTGVYALALWSKNNDFSAKKFDAACERIKKSRPTAVNLEYEVNKVQRFVRKILPCDDLHKKLINYAEKQIQILRKSNTKMAHFAEEELSVLYSKEKLNILTHCNTGTLACGCIGTALGVIEHLGMQKKIDNVWVDETRPYFQGSRLTAYELGKLDIPYQVVVDSAASLLMRTGLVDAIFVGADRISANGDVANKVGTANLSIIAKFYNVPFFVVAPKSSFDIGTSVGDNIKIELRPENEVTSFDGKLVSPIGSKAYNPSFDITENVNITGIICEDKCLKPPYLKSIMEIFNV